MYTASIYFCDTTTARRRTNQIREVPAQQSRPVMFSSAYTQAYKQCTFIILHKAELFGNRVSLAGLLLVSGLHIPYFLGSGFPHSTQTSKLITGSQAKYFLSSPHFLVLQHLDKFLLIKRNRVFLLRSRIKLKQQHDSNAQGVTAGHCYAPPHLITTKLSCVKREEVCFKQAVQFLPSTILDLAR